MTPLVDGATTLSPWFPSAESVKLNLPALEDQRPSPFALWRRQLVRAAQDREASTVNLTSYAAPRKARRS